MKRRIKRLGIAMLFGLTVVGTATHAFAGKPGGKNQMMGEQTFAALDGMTEQERLEFLEDKLDKRVAAMTQRLDLTTDQQQKVRQIIADAQTQLLEIYDKHKGSKDKTVARAEAQAVMKQAKQDVGDILTDDQKATMKKMRQNRHAEAKLKMVNRLDERLNLSDAQRTQVEQILEQTHQELRKNRKEGDRAKGSGKGIMEAAGDDIAKILTPQQKAKFDKMREKMRERAAQRKKTRRSGAF